MSSEDVQNQGGTGQAGAEPEGWRRRREWWRPTPPPPPPPMPPSPPPPPPEYPRHPEHPTPPWSGPSEPRYPPHPCTHTYVVRPGDSMWKIAQCVGVSVAQLAQMNPHIPNPNQLVVGDVLCVPRPCVPPPPPPPPPPAVPGWCCQILRQVHPLARVPAVSLLHMGRQGHVLIALHDMPDPSRFDGSCDVYRGWLLDRLGHVKTMVELLPAGRGFWIGHADTDVENGDVVLVTAEDERCYDRPTGPEIYRTRVECAVDSMAQS